MRSTMTTPVAARPSASRFLRWGAAAAVLGLLGLCAYALLRGPEHGAARHEALELLATDGFDAAESRLQLVGDQNPGDVEVVRALAQGYLDARRSGEAEVYLNRWCDLRPGQPEPYRRRLDLWNQQQKMLPALADAERVLRLDPADVPTRRQLAHLLFVAGRYDQAEREAVRCL